MPTTVTVEELSSFTNQKQSIKFTDYDCLGFDLDNTICRYKIGSMVKLEYETIAKFLVDKRGYPSDHLMQPIENNLDFMLKGLILDVENGNILHIAPDGHIVHGSHGTKELTKEDLVRCYGPECRWKVTDEFSRDPLHTWNGPYSEQMRTLLDYFDMPAGLIFARVVDTLDEKNGGPMKSYSIWPDLLDAMQEMFDKQHFQLNKGGYFNEIKANPDNYIHKCSDELINWFKTLRTHKKLLFLITGSNVDFASHTATNSMGPNWKELFDIIICFAKKPGFFIGNRPFIGVNGFEETGPVSEADLERGGIYTYGNWNGLYEFLKKHSKHENPKVVYVGDNLVQDVYTPAVHANCDTVAVCEELEAEGAFGHDPVHVDQEFLVSSTWGSYFLHKDERRYTIWRDIINKHSKACIPSLEYVAAKPLNQEYSPIHLLNE
ncbi:hypothetical protein ILUMI_20461 [Ignelater luminosus]|uniref:5'-nucleotidase domain-containing protein 1 n=1 Tax=Ignelater luminosus TaxID=2038154 RepID=A0A8K0G4T9_IGNLU|nr:hypothetical protein ILUMI_20461 [Ignelater luminosus]